MDLSNKWKIPRLSRTLRLVEESRGGDGFVITALMVF